ncbi:MAG TPA: DNA translocase FtsK 4TM domain-containing protein [Gemmataceae bacterium]|nr:DNA translocase FtsK 4TM domain-containing protein [Gemmataceae bacterium]
MSDRARFLRPPLSLPGPRWRLDLAAGILFVAGLLAALCVFSHDPADPPAPSVYPPNARPANLLGAPGARVSQALIDSLGAAVHVLLASWFVLVVLLALRRGLLRWSLRLAGWLLLVPIAAVFADRLAFGSGQDFLGAIALAGPGGSIGAWLSLWLARVLPPAGQFVVLAAALLLALVLAMDVLLWRVTKLAWSACRGAVRWARRLAATEDRTPLPPAPSLKRRGGERQSLLPLSASERGLRRGVPPEEDEEDELAEQEEEEEERETPPSSTAITRRPIPIRYHDRLETSTLLTTPRSPVPPVQESSDQFADYELPPLTLLADPEPLDQGDQEQMLQERANLLEKTFADFGLGVQVVGINTGPVITQYEVALDTGLRVQKVTRLADDIALNLSVPSVRIVAPIPGKNTVGIETPNERRARVRLKEVLVTAGKKAAQCRIPIFLGKDAEGRPLVQDLADMPHLLIAGTTGTGKSVCMNTIILSILMTRRPDEIRMIMIDPKQTELDAYSRIPHLMHPVVTDMKKAEAILAWAVDKMEERYDLLRRARVKGIAGYNDLGHDEVLRRVQPEDEEERQRIPDHMPYIVIFIDEMADLIMLMRKEVEGHIIRLAQKARASGIHLVVATQRPTVDVITGLIKSNLPARICFKVASKSDSRVVLDEGGGDKLLGKGDMLFLPPGTSTLVRAQGTFADEQEIDRVIEKLETDEPCYAEELMQLSVARAGGNLIESLRERDELYEAAIEIIVREQRGSVSLLQRTLGIGYGRAARLIDFMAEDGIVGAYNGSNAREVLYSPEQWDQLRGSSVGSP